MTNDRKQSNPYPMKPLLPTLAFLTITTFSFAQPHRHLDQDHNLVEYSTLEHWLGKAAELKDRILISNGLWPMPEKTPLNPSLGPESKFEGYTVQGVRLETRPGFYLTGTLYIPDGGDGPFPAVLSPHGHWSTGRFENSELASIPGRSIHFAQQGYVVFSYSMIGYNETKDLIPHRFDEPAYQLWGFSAMGLQLWNSVRALDFLMDLSNVDASRIGMTGASGGGTQTFLLTAVDDRIRVAAPVNMISAHFQGGCICENAPLLRQNASNVEIGALSAPRPLMMVSTSGDWTTNTPDVEFPAIQRIYGLFEAEDQIDNTHLDYPHNYNKDSREAVYRWFNRWLKDDASVVQEPALTIPEQAQLEAPTPEAPAPIETLFASFKKDSERQFERVSPSSWSTWNNFKAVYGEAFSHLLPPALDAHIEATPFSSRRIDKAQSVVLIIHDSDPDSQERARTVAEEAEKEGLRAMLYNPYPAGDDFTPPDSIEYWTTYNPTVAARRVAEIQTIVQQLYHRQDVTDIDLVGLGNAGAWALLARTQLPFVRKTHIDFNHKAYESDTEFLDNAYIPLIRRAGGFKTAVALTLPSPLTIENLPDGSLTKWMQKLYKELDAEDLLEVAKP